MSVVADPMTHPQSHPSGSEPKTLAALRRRVFELASTEDRPEPVFDLLCRYVEERFPEARCTATMVSSADHSLRLVAAPSLPAPLREALATVHPDSTVGLSPISAATGEAAITRNVVNDPRWRQHREQVLAAGIHAACSYAILGARLDPERGRHSLPPRVLGTVDAYLDTAGEPPVALVDLLQTVTILASATLQSLESKDRIRRQRSFDQLTGLPNRRLFGVELERALEEADPRRDRLALLLLDLDHFKDLNDTVGYATGDALLRAAADRLAELRRPGELVARLGDDDFAVLMSDARNGEGIEARARQILQTMRMPYDFSGQALAVTSSAGVSLYPWDGRDAATILRSAEKALGAAKRRGRNCLQQYAATLGTADFDTLQLKTSLQMALTEGELEIEYQPIIESGTRRIHAVEALSVWQHPTRGRLPAARFIPLAEETGLIRQIGEQVLAAGCTQASAWQRLGDRPVQISLNVSANQFQDPDFVDLVRDALERSGLPGESLILEITERTATTDAGQAAIILRRLADMGVRIALDDFGTGYSSMGQLKRLAIHWLKIDRSFVRGLPHDQDNRAITRAILAMAEALRLTVVAEGIETPDEASFLTGAGCELIQGYLYSRAVGADEISELLASGEPLAPQKR